MENWQNHLTFFLLMWIVAFIVNVLFNLFRIKTAKKKAKLGEVALIAKLKKVNLDNINWTVQNILTSIINSFILSFVGTFVTIFEWNYAIQMIVGFSLLFGLMYALYDIYGRILKSWEIRKELKK